MTARSLIGLAFAVVAGAIGALVPGTPAAAAPGQFTFHDLPPGVEAQTLVVDGGSVWFTDGLGTAIGRMSTSGGSTTSFSDEFGGFGDLAAGPGGIWFASYGVQAGSGYLTGGGQFVRFETDEAFPQPVEGDRIARGPDGQMWLTNYSRARVIPLSTAGAGDAVSAPEGLTATSITAGPDGRLWVQLTGWVTSAPTQLGRFSPGATEVSPIELPNWMWDAGPGEIITGPDGRIWFSQASNWIARVRPTVGASISSLPVITGPDHPGGIVSGTDGNVWYVANGTDESAVGRITPAGAVSEYRHAQLDRPSDIAVDETTGDLWMADGDQLVRFEPTPVRFCDGRVVTDDLAFGSVDDGLVGGVAGNDVVLGTAGADRINVGWGDDLVCAGGGSDRVVDGDGFNALRPDRFFGQGGNDTLTGGYGNDTLDGGTGNDVLKGGPGNDRLVGGTQRDTCNGGLGRDSQAGCEVRLSIP